MLERCVVITENSVDSKRLHWSPFLALCADRVNSRFVLLTTHEILFPAMLVIPVHVLGDGAAGAGLAFVAPGLRSGYYR